MKKNGGRPSRYADWLTEDRLRVIRMWKRGGLTDKEISKKIGVRTQTISEWKKRFPQFAEAFKNGKDEADASAEESLLALFQKQTITETRVEKWTDANGKEKQHVIKTTKEVQPSAAAIIFYLKAKAGWRDNTIVTDSSAIDKLDQILKQTQDSAEMEEDDDE